MRQCIVSKHLTAAPAQHLPLRHAKRYQSFIGEQRLTARLSKSAYRNPLAPKDPALRTVVVPDSVHKTSRQSNAVESADVMKKRAQRALLLQLQQEVMWEGVVLDSEDHKLVQHFVKLGKNPKYRDSRRMLIVGGREMIRELCERGHAPRHLLVTRGKEVPEWASRLHGTEIVAVDRKVASACSPGNDGYIGDFDIPPPPPKETLIANKQRMNRVLVLDNVDDPGTLGTVLRTAVGFQYDAVITMNHCADLYDHRVIRASRGAHFQSGTPIYTLKEEDGDDVYGLINHVIQRNDLLPVSFTAQDDEDTRIDDYPRTSSVVGAKPVDVQSVVTSPPQRETLSDFCLKRFCSQEEGKDRGYILFAGSNHKRNTLRRLTQKVSRRPTQLLLDSMPESPDMLLSLSVVMHALRPSGDWDYLPLHEKTEPSSMELQTRKASVDIGANRLVVSERSLNLDEDEQREAAHTANEFMKWKRLHKKKHGDYDFWMNAENKRTRNMLHNEKERRANPWDTRRMAVSNKLKDVPDWVPNIIDEYRQPLDRDRLVEEREWNEKFVRPTNYDKP